MQIPKALQHLLRDIDDLILLPGNPRQGDVGQISLSLERFGQLKPIVVNEDGVILAGNHTYMAAKALGWEQVAAVTAGLEGQEQTAFALADNRLSDLATYDHQALLDMATGLDDLTGTGYDLDDLDLIEQDIQGGLEDLSGDERYTPAWIFEAMGLEFDIDLAAPPGGIPYIPADRYFTKDDDALTQDWTGLFAWCNPPFSSASAFGQKWNAEIKEGVWLGPQTRGSPYRLTLMQRSTMLWLPLDLGFHNAGAEDAEGIRYPVFLAGIGRGEKALRNLASAHPDKGVLAAVVP